MKDQWITNCTKEGEADLISKLGGDLFSGDPKASSKYSVEQLKNMRIIGLYRKDHEDGTEAKHDSRVV